MTLLTSQQAASELGVSVKAIHKMVQRGLLKGSMFGSALAFTPAAINRARNRPKRGRPIRKPSPA